MDNKGKVTVTGIIIGAFALGWWLHKQSTPIQGNVNLDITSDAFTWYSLTQNGGSTVILAQSNGENKVSLPPGDYELHADFQGG
jgi:hypothetical protein